MNKDIYIYVCYTRVCDNKHDIVSLDLIEEKYPNCTPGFQVKGI